MVPKLNNSSFLPPFSKYTPYMTSFFFQQPKTGRNLKLFKTATSFGVNLGLANEFNIIYANIFKNYAIVLNVLMCKYY